MRFCKDKGTTSKSQNRGIITCIPQRNKLNSLTRFSFDSRKDKIELTLLTYDVKAACWFSD